MTNDTPTRTVETRDEAGRLKTSAPVDAEGRLHGTFTAYDDRGQPELVMRYVGGRAEGLAVAYSGGRKLAEMTYAGGLLHGPMHSYDPAGRPTAVVHYAHGQRHGPMQAFGPDGLPRMTAVYAQGRLNGLTTEYDDKGRIRRRASYKDDLLDGEEIHFHPSGHPRERTLFRAGVVIEGPQSFADPDEGKAPLLSRLLGKGSTAG